MRCPNCGYEWNSRAKIVSPVGDILVFFLQECEKLKGFKPTINNTKDPSAASRLLKNMAVEDVKKAISFFLMSDKSDKVGITLSAALSTHSINKYLHSKAEGQNGIDRYKRILGRQGAGNTTKT